ncbi:MAG: hypothetical protein COA86_05700 [Kangiella sp.]|nr:MAG: hypothetical protein COA86_05700 [Kangiella sp.]
MFEVIVMNFSLIFKKSFLVLFFYMLFSMQAVFGDDTEIFFAPEDDVENIIPNVMFIIDTSGSMNNKPSGSSQTRIQIVKEVMDDVLSNISNVNVGLMRFNKGDTSGANSSEGGPVLFPATFIDDPSDPIVTSIISDGDNDAEQIDSAGTVVLNAELLSLGGSTDSYVAVRFESLLVPQGATILSANIVFTANGDTSDTANLIVDAELTDDSDALTDTTNSITDKKASATTQFVNWTPESWNSGSAYSTPELITVVQEVVDQAGWCGGNAMTFFITGDAERAAYTIEGSDSDSDEDDYYPAPKLRIKYSNTLPAGANGCTDIKLSSQIVDEDHDWVRFDDGTVGNSFTYNVAYYNGYANGFGLSFSNINIPQGATVKDAYITLYSQTNETGDGEVDVKGVNLANGDPDDYTLLYDNATLGPVNWVHGDWVRLEPINSPSLTSMVQDIVNLAGWNLGNTMSFYIEGIDGYQYSYSADFSTTLSPKLTISYNSTFVSGIVTKREEMKAEVALLPADAWTPISDTMAEAGLYFRGEEVYYGIDRDNVSTNRTSHIDSFENTGTLVVPAGCTEDNYSASACASEKITGNPDYVSPIEDSCQTSHIVFLTDGYPTSHHSATNDIYNEWSGNTCSSSSYGTDCAVKIAGYLHDNDQNSILTGIQTVTTHTIGFDIDFQLLEDMAEAGGGTYYTTDTKDGLVDAIESIVADIASVNTSFVSSGVSVNQYNRLTHNDELYFSLFAPASGNVWPGNIKRYKLSGSQISDINDISAVGTNGEFTQSSESWWGGFVDGNEVGAGGVASQRAYGESVYSNISGDDLSTGANAVRDSNSAITQEMLGASSSSDRTDILDWAQGLDVDAASTTAHNVIGDPLHSQPSLVIYNTTSVASPTYETKIYVGTNHGFLHSFDSEDGANEWSFIPQELLPILSDIQKGNDVGHVYGLDGGIATIIIDDNNNGVVDVAINEKAYLYVGMRRGGSSYYAIDISDPDVPLHMFTINPETSGFDSLGQTWSTPIIKRMNIGGQTDRLVLLFGGGYDEVQDTAGTSVITDSIGNLVYIADAITGEHLWNSRGTVVQASSPAGSVTDMNSVPSEISALDLDADGLIDTFYVSDTRAQIFRFDINNETEVITGGKIASLQSASDTANNRRFYYKPDTALIRTTNETFISVSIGSGYRAHPLDKNIDDNFYMIKDVGGLSATFDMNVSRSDLADITSLVGDSDGDGISDAAAQIDSLGARGWYLTFSTDGEKVIERSLTFNNAVLFTTYLPPGSGTNVCEAVTGNSRLYAVKILDGNPYVDNLADGTFDEQDRYIELTSPGISPPPQPLFNDEIRLCVGTECDLGNLLPPTPDGIMGIRWRRDPAG